MAVRSIAGRSSSHCSLLPMAGSSWEPNSPSMRGLVLPTASSWAYIGWATCWRLRPAVTGPAGAVGPVVGVPGHPVDHVVVRVEGPRGGRVVAHERQHPDDVGGDRPHPLHDAPPGGPELPGRAHVGPGVVDRARLAGAEVVLGLVHEDDEQPAAEGGQAFGLGVDGGVVGTGGDVGPAEGGAAEDAALPALEQEPALSGVGLLL